MLTDDKPVQKTTPQPPAQTGWRAVFAGRGRGPLIALASAAGVILIGAVFALLSLSGGDEPAPPATEPQSTTASPVVPTTAATELDPIVEQGRDFAVSFMDALIAGDLETAQSQVIDSVPLGLFLVTSTATFDGEVAWRDALGWTAELNGCEITLPDPTRTRVTCTVTHSTDISRALGVGPYTGEYFLTIKYAGGTHFNEGLGATTVVDKEQNPRSFVDYGSFEAEAWDGFMAWLEANHGDELETVMWRNFQIGPPDSWLTGEWRPEYSAESVALWGQYSQEYVAQLDG
jgi:hypothetical protein